MHQAPKLHLEQRFLKYRYLLILCSQFFIRKAAAASSASSTEIITPGREKYESPKHNGAREARTAIIDIILIAFRPFPHARYIMPASSSTQESRAVINGPKFA